MLNVAYQQDTVCLLFVRESNRFKSVKYDRIACRLNCCLQIQALQQIKMASMPTRDTNTCTGALHH